MTAASKEAAVRTATIFQFEDLSRSVGLVLNFVNKQLGAVEKWVCSAGLLVSTFLVFAQVLNRYWLHYEIMWIGDLALYIFVFSYISAIAFTTFRKGHISVEMFKSRFLKDSPIGLAVYDLVMDILSLAAVMIFLIPVKEFFLRSLKYPEYGTLVRWFNQGWLIYALFGVVILSSIHLLFQIKEDMAKISRLRSEAPEGGDQ
jgi:TRAP-type C4-dicarboxylate transport system permease small subunit